MTNGTEAAREVVSTGLAPTEPAPTGKHADDGSHGGCLNCGTELVGRYCHQCGQSAHVHRTLGHVFEEFAHGVLHVDGKLWRTIPMLILNPGRLTRDYTHGRRARYIAPLGLYLFMVLLTFIVFGFLAGGIVKGPPIIANVEEARAAVGELRADYAAAKQDPASDATTLAAQAAAIRLAEDAIRRAERGETDGVGIDVMSAISEASGEGGTSFGVNTGNPEVDAKLRNTLQDPEFFLYKLQQKAYKLSFLLIPLSLPILWLVFAGRKDVTLYDHSVFILYSLSFMLLLASVAALLDVLGNFTAPIIGPLLFLAPPLHIFAQLKGAYCLSIRGALWRTTLLLIGALAALLSYLAILFALGLLD